MCQKSQNLYIRSFITSKNVGKSGVHSVGCAENLAGVPQARFLITAPTLAQ